MMNYLDISKQNAIDSSQRKAVITFTFLLSILIIATGINGVFFPEFYSKETPNWQAQSVGQDFINLLFIVPFFLIVSIVVYNRNPLSLLLWAGTVVYLAYTYMIYCFNIHFNIFFIEYCIILGLSFYALVYFFYKQIKSPSMFVSNKRVIKTVGIYFIGLAALFYFLWLSDIIPAIVKRTTPQNLIDTGLFTNPVHILDLSIFLPALFIAGLLILKEHKIGFLLAPILLVFCILMDLTIAGLTFIMHKKGIDVNLSVTIIMGLMGIFSLLILTWYLNNIEIHFSK